MFVQVMVSMNLCLVVGLSVDYVVHLAEGYHLSVRRERGGRTQDMLANLGISVLTGAATTLGAAFFMMFAKIQFFLQVPNTGGDGGYEVVCDGASDGVSDAKIQFFLQVPNTGRGGDGGYEVVCDGAGGGGGHLSQKNRDKRWLMLMHFYLAIIISAHRGIVIVILVGLILITSLHVSSLKKRAPDHSFRPRFNMVGFIMTVICIKYSST
jgi:hypothetical protein